MKKRIAIIGSGFSALASASYLAKEGHQVTIYEKNDTVGGRARQYKKDGFTFDIGPTWYWMPDVFERFFNDFDKKPSDYYTLEKLSPAYKVVFSETESILIEDTLTKIYAAFEAEEKGSSKQLEKFIGKIKFGETIKFKNSHGDIIEGDFAKFSTSNNRIVIPLSIRNFLGIREVKIYNININTGDKSISIKDI